MKKTIFLVHNDWRLYDSVRDWLGRSYNFVPVLRLSEALFKAEKRYKPDLIILAFYEKGETFLWYIGKLSRIANVIVWSGYTLENFQTPCLEAGAFRCVTKSDDQGLLTAIEKALRN